jgi:2-aminoadipate transaminase
MRLNFSGVNDAEIREGIKRIGRVIGEQVELYEALAPGTSETPASAAAPPAKDEGAARLGNVVPLRKEANG